jgi:low affinity Fe/Cu permease
MKEYEELFSMALQQKLKKRIIAKIFVKITRNDEILVTIEREDEDKFKMFIENFSDKFINGLNSEYVAYEVIKAYREFLIAKMDEKYFYQD